MGREVKRVPVDFDWPLNKVWSGYLSSFNFPTCDACEGSGLPPEARCIERTFYPHMIGGPNADALAWHDKISQAEVDHLRAEGRLNRPDFGGEWRTDLLTAAEVNASRHPHDAINRWILVRYRCEAIGLSMTCSTCNGEGEIATDAEREAAAAWEPTEPPAGEGWQLWETVSEGSPISPVFDTPEGLADWMESSAYKWGAQSAWPKGSALPWITDPGWAPSFIAYAPSTPEDPT